ncbi:MAG: T9SS type A sorting domain-containing protein [Flavobacterium sp.]|nr:MAG: T9SS type A sorting domain-containing protein [Flavobacterium sp.]
MKNTFTYFMLLAIGLTALPMKAQWAPVTSPTTGNLEAIDFIDANTGFISGGFVSRLYKTTDGGVTWTSFSNFPMREVHFLNATTAYASSHVASQVGTMQKSVNGGTTFTGITPPNSSSYLGVYATSPTTAFFINTENKVLKTSNSGASVTSYTLGVTGSGNQVTDIHFSDANTGYICTITGNLFKTTNAGATWTLSPTGISASLRSIQFVTPQIGYMGGSKVLKTINGGATWTEHTIPGSNSITAMSFYDANNGIVVGLSGKIFRTADGGNTWIPQVSGTTQHLRNVYFVDANTAVAVGDNGTVLRNAAVLASNEVVKTPVVTFYPNPISSQSTLSISDLQINDALKLEVYNTNGQLVREEKITSSEFVFQKGSLQAGIYLVNIKDKNETLKTIKIVVE